MKKISRRSFLAASAAGISTVAMSACGTEVADSSQVAASTSGDAQSVDPTATKHKIGVAVGGWDADALLMKSYYDTYLAEAFNCEFVWAEETSGKLEVMINFIDTCSIVGVEAIVDCSAWTGDQLSSVANKCNDYGIWYIENNSAVEPDIMSVPHYGGTAGADPAGVAEQFAEMTKRIIDDGEPHSVLVHTGAALLGISQHTLASAAIVEAVVNVFDLDIGTTDYVELVTTTTVPVVLETGSDEIKLALESTFPVAPDAFFSMLKDGEYDTVILPVPQYLTIETVISEVEASFNKNIHVISLAAPTETTRNSFGTLDGTGNQSLDAAVIKNNGINGILFAMAYNCVSGYGDQLKLDGAQVLFNAPMWTCYNLEEYEKMAQLDVEGGAYFTYRIDDIKEMLFAFNADLDTQMMHDLADSISSLEMVLERNGL